MKKILSLLIIFVFGLALTACSKSKVEGADTNKTYSVVYKGDAYILDAEGTLVRTMSNQASIYTDKDPLNEEDEDEIIDESLWAIEENGGIEEDETDPVEEEDDVVVEKTFDEVSIVSADDGYYLCSKDGKKISKTYELLVDEYSGLSTSKEPEKFFAVDGKGIHSLDEEGKEKKTNAIYNINYIEAYGDYVVYNVIGTRIETASGIMNSSLKVLVEPADYYEIQSLLAYSDGNESDDIEVFVAKYKNDNNEEVIDFIDEEGKVLIESALSFAYVDDEKVAVLRDDTVGFMDFEGNWITENSTNSIDLS